MSPAESGDLAHVRARVDSLYRFAIMQSVFGARPWVPVTISVVALIVSLVAVVRGETRRAEVLQTRIEGGIYP